ncbi:hypothetical protein HMPREF1624_00800 [Sporothrix schenckii ATCC 58251]|uniref:Transcription factor domain-containing protein n=1 Tax=Sporothrix schenckii (strain ATCC 58251 / de Perez 2211183) TaxID=1391915 RepID=U7Q708_SPOS1|nr:hypothetical protein HMPREF1624_00800 [Sporothrix schenckii ATCC 58251]
MAPTREVYRRVRTARRECRYDVSESAARRSESNGGFQFDASHVWLDTPEVRFVHTVATSTDDTDANTESNTATNVSTPAQPSPEPDTGVLFDDDGHMPALAAEHAAHQPVPEPVSEPVSTPAYPVTAPTPSHNATDFASPYSTTSGGSPDTIVDPMQSLIRMRASGSVIYTPGPTQPLRDPQIATLLQHYTQHLAGWFDVNDPHRQFETFVPFLALSCPVLLHAVLALSACHLHRRNGSRYGVHNGHGPHDKLYASQFHDLCIQDLIPALADPATALDNVLPISTVVLRMYEMLSYESGGDNEATADRETDAQRNDLHRRGCSSLFIHNRKNIGFRALKRTAFWTYFREEIMVALASRRPTAILPRHWKVDITWGGDYDYVKTEQMTMLMAEVVDFCFGQGGGGDGDGVDNNNNNNNSNNSDTHPPDRWSDLQREVSAWHEALPESFQPLAVLDDGGPFPHIFYLSTWHMIAMQFYHLAKVLLALHNPHPARGMDFLGFARALETEILEHALQLCGMTKTTGDKHPGVLVNAVQPLVICGRIFKKPDEQAELVHMLQRIEEVTAVSTAEGIQSLNEAWGMG